MVEPEAWIAAGMFVAPGLAIGRGAVIGAANSILADMLAEMISIGHPRKLVRSRRTEPTKRGSIEGAAC